MNQDLLYKYIAGDATPEEKESITRWLDADARNMKQFLALRKLHDITLWQRLPTIQTSSKRITLRFALIKTLKVAAVFAIAFLVAYTYQGNFNKKIESSLQTIFVPAGQRAQLTLSDGTKVWLNAKTTLTFPTQFEANSRNVKLDGEGYFDVAHQQEQPFIVETERYNITVLGTEFNVTAYAKSDIFETALLRGSVKVGALSGKTIQLEPHTRTYLENGVLQKGAITHSDYFLWKEGVLCFENETVEELMKKLQLYYDVTIEIKNTSLFEKCYSGKFRTKDGIEHVLKVLQLNNKFTYTKDSTLNRITIE